MSFREIDVTGLRPAEMADQAAPVLDWVAIDRLVIDDRYQRPLAAANRAAVQAIVDAFVWAKFSPVLVAPTPDGRLAVIDGQHRVHAARLCGLERVPAQIVLLSVAEQAGAFAGVNGSAKPITVHQLYRAALAAGEDWAVRCRDVVQGAGCHLATSNPSGADRKARVVYCVASVRRLVTRGQAAALDAGLRAIVAYDVGGRVALYSDYILGPFIQALAMNAGFLRIDLAAFLRTNDPFKVIGRAERARAEGRKISNAQAFEVLVRALQAGRGGVMAFKVASRADDDLVLQVLALRSRGVSTVQIGSMFGMRDAYVRVMTNRVRDADLTESGEAAVAVEAGYW